MNKGPFLPRHHRDNPVIREYEHAVERGRRLLQDGYHVVHHDSGWKVKQTGASRGRLFDTQSEAIEAARRMAQNKRTELFIHGRDGRIRERNSYGNDPYPPRG